MRKPGDRRKVWRSTCNSEGSIMFFISLMWFSTMCPIGAVLGIIGLICSFSYFQDAKRGWKMNDKRPPWADEHDAIDKKRAYKFEAKPVEEK